MDKEDLTPLLFVLLIVGFLSIALLFQLWWNGIITIMLSSALIIDYWTAFWFILGFACLIAIIKLKKKN